MQREKGDVQHVLTGTSATTTDSLETIFQDRWPRERRDFQWTLCRAWPRLSGQGILLPWRHDEYEAKPGGREAGRALMEVLHV